MKVKNANIKIKGSIVTFKYPTMRSFLRTSKFCKTNLELVNPVVEITRSTVSLKNNIWPHADMYDKHCCLGSSYRNVYSLLSNKQYDAAYHLILDYLSTFNNNGYWRIYIHPKYINQKQEDYVVDDYNDYLTHKNDITYFKCGTSVTKCFAKNIKKIYNLNIEQINVDDLILCDFCGRFNDKSRSNTCGYCERSL